MIDLGNAEARKVKPPQPHTLGGIAAFHYMEAEKDGVRVWLVADIGSGRLVTWDEIKKHHHNKEVVDPRVEMLDVPPAVDRNRAADAIPPSNEMKPKIHRSHQNVKAMKERKKAAALQRRIDKELKFQKSVEEYSRRIEEEDQLKCQWCSRVMSSVESLERHQTDGCTSKRGKKKKAADYSTSRKRAAAAAATTTTTTTSVTAAISASNEGEWV